MGFLAKVLISGLIVVGASSVAKKNPLLAGIIIALPIKSILLLYWAYRDQPNMQAINALAMSILWAVAVSLTFFIPFAVNRWWKLDFWYSLGVGILILSVSYGAAYFWVRR